jgi:hypothetical protein
MRVGASNFLELCSTDGTRILVVGHGFMLLSRAVDLANSKPSGENDTSMVWPEGPEFGLRPALTGPPPHPKMPRLSAPESAP